jgi:predicted dehydrogenase
MGDRHVIPPYHISEGDDGLAMFKGKKTLNLLQQHHYYAGGLSMDVIRWGVIGCGGIADRRTIPEGIIPSKESKLVAVMDLNKRTAKRVSEKYGVERFYTNEEELLKDPAVDAVYIATPSYLHAKQSVMAAEHGKHVLCEKPLALTIKECNDVLAACKRNNVKLQVGFMMRFHACHREALRIINEGLIGQPVMGRAQLTCWYPEILGAWRQDPRLGGGGSLMDMGIHCIDLLRMFFGEVMEVTAFTDTLIFKYPVEDVSVVTLRFKDGPYGVVDNHFNIPDSAAQNRLEIYGTKGCILTDGTIGQDSRGKIKVYTQEAEAGYDAAQKREGIQMREIEPEYVNIYKGEIEHFVTCIKKNVEPVNSGYEAVQNLKVVLAAYESSKTGRKVEIKD